MLFVEIALFIYFDFLDIRYSNDQYRYTLLIENMVGAIAF